MSELAMVTDAGPAEVSSAKMACEIAVQADSWDEYLATGHPRNPDRLYFGSEFCERLLPDIKSAQDIILNASNCGLPLTFKTPISSDGFVKLIGNVLEMLPADSEVICNDWGVAALVSREFRHLRPVAGRQLCKMIKDPRLPSEQWLKLSPHGLRSKSFISLLGRLHISSIEVDIPPFASIEFFSAIPFQINVHKSVGYAAKGRICKIGSLHSPPGRKFLPGGACKWECKHYVAETKRSIGGRQVDLSTFQRGNTVFYRHSPEMEQVLLSAIGLGLISRVVHPEG